MGLKILKAAKADIYNSLSNKYFESILDTSDEWIKKRTGIEFRKISDDSTSEIAKKSVDNLNLSTDEKKRIKLIIVSTVSPDYITPNISSIIHGHLKLPTDVFCMDINMACAGFVGACINAEKFLKKDELALIIGAEILTKYTNYSDRSSAILFGDGSGAVLFEKNSEEFYCDYRTIGNNFDLEIKSNKFGGNQCIKMNGKEVFKFVIEQIPMSIISVLEKSKLSKEDIDFFVLHQANERMKNFIAKEFCEEKFYSNIKDYGNTSSASIPIALSELYEKNLLKDKKIIISGFGGGLIFGTAYIRG